jgi:hypothetical protein
MAPSHIVSAAVLGLLASAGAACASRDVPHSYPKTSAASPDATEAPVAVVTRALDSEPPLPGTSAEGWAGLMPSAGAPPAGHAGHGAHQHGGASQPAAADHSAHGSHQQGPAQEQVTPQGASEHSGHGAQKQGGAPQQPAPAADHSAHQGQQPANTPAPSSAPKPPPKQPAHDHSKHQHAPQPAKPAAEPQHNQGTHDDH